MPYFVYLLECRDGSYYCGFTKNVAARLSAHNKGTGAKYTRARRPVKLVYFEGKKTLKTAMRRELEIKSFPHSRKRAMIASRAMYAFLNVFRPKMVLWDRIIGR